MGSLERRVQPRLRDARLAREFGDVPRGDAARPPMAHALAHPRPRWPMQPFEAHGHDLLALGFVHSRSCSAGDVAIPITASTPRNGSFGLESAQLRMAATALPTPDPCSVHRWLSLVSRPRHRPPFCHRPLRLSNYLSEPQHFVLDIAESLWFPAPVVILPTHPPSGAHLAPAGPHVSPGPLFRGAG